MSAPLAIWDLIAYERSASDNEVTRRFSDEQRRDLEELELDESELVPLEAHEVLRRVMVAKPDWELRELKRRNELRRNARANDSDSGGSEDYGDSESRGVGSTRWRREDDVSVVFSLRLDRDEIRQLRELGNVRGVAPSALARRFIRNGLVAAR